MKSIMRKLAATIALLVVGAAIVGGAQAFAGGSDSPSPLLATDSATPSASIEGSDDDGTPDQGPGDVRKEDDDSSGDDSSGDDGSHDDGSHDDGDDSSGHDDDRS